MLHAQELTKTFRTPGDTVAAVTRCSLDAAPGEVTVVRGRSGSGKSTLLGMLALLIRPESGTITLGGQVVSGLSDSALSDLRASSVGVVFQAFNLLPHLTALQNVALPVPGKQAQAELRAAELLERVGLADRAGHRPGELSGGEQQRVAIARALVNRPSVLLADEPTGNLDADSEELVLRQLRSAAADGCAVVIASHSEVVSAAGERVLLMDRGRLVPWEPVAATPVSEQEGAK